MPGYFEVGDGACGTVGGCVCAWCSMRLVQFLRLVRLCRVVWCDWLSRMIVIVRTFAFLFCFVPFSPGDPEDGIQ